MRPGLCVCDACLSVFFFFQAEDGIRDLTVTGVQTCALPIFQSHGGVAPIAESGRLAAGAVLSGPARGVARSVYAPRLQGEQNLIPFDMGGTSTDICLVLGGAATLVMGRRIGGPPHPPHNPRRAPA